MKPFASLSLDLDNLWTYLKVRGDPAWQSYPSYLDRFVPLILKLLHENGLRITFFVVGQDFARKENHRWMQEIAEAGHEFGNHSFFHEPWMTLGSLSALKQELKGAHDAICTHVGQPPVGFRGPGFALSLPLLEAVYQMGYLFDASLLPSSLGPIARWYYQMHSPVLSEEEKNKRKELFGSFKQATLPIKPFFWSLPEGNLLEIPVTTLPFFRFPFHFSYVIWLSQFSHTLARFYFRFALNWCLCFKVEPSILLHPLDFLGREDAPELRFFPGMDLPRQHKLLMAELLFRELKERFVVLPMSEYAQQIGTNRRVIQWT